MHGYIAFYKGKRIEVHADSALDARNKAAAEFKARKSYDVTIVLAEKNDKPVIHKADF